MYATCFAKWRTTCEDARRTKFWQSFIVAGVNITEFSAKNTSPIKCDKHSNHNQALSLLSKCIVKFRRMKTELRVIRLIILLIWIFFTHCIDDEKCYIRDGINDDKFWTLCWHFASTLIVTVTLLTLKVLNFWKFTSYCSLKPLWSGMGEVVPARTSPTLHPPFPPTVHQLLWLAL